MTEQITFVLIISFFNWCHSMLNRVSAKKCYRAGKILSRNYENILVSRNYENARYISRTFYFMCLFNYSIQRVYSIYIQGSDKRNKMFTKDVKLIDKSCCVSKIFPGDTKWIKQYGPRSWCHLCQKKKCIEKWSKINHMHACTCINTNIVHKNF